MTSFLSGNCDGCYWELSNNIIGCRTCVNCDSLVTCLSGTVQKVIQKQVRAKASLFTMNLGTVTVGNQLNNNNYQYPQNMANKPYIIPKTKPPVPVYSQNPSSDRVAPAHSNTNLKFTYVPSHGNSTKSTLTRNKPGASMPGGKGVDVKHNSYARYLARRKSSTVMTQKEKEPKPKMGNKTKMIGMISNCTRCIK